MCERMRLIVFGWFLCLVGTLSVGCGTVGAPHRVQVHGAVTTNDSMIAAGTIRFIPQPGNRGSIAVTSIKDGVYHFSSANGPYPGEFKVVVNLELDHAEFVSMGSSSSALPKTTWETAVTVPTEAKAIRHFTWP